jgi:hypothetical protein
MDGKIYKFREQSEGLPEVKALSGHFSPLTGKSSSVHMKRIM